jgi:hypothetical protein
VVTPKLLPRLFTKFSTTSPTRTGLGLYICKNILEAHGGRMWVKIIRMVQEQHLSLVYQSSDRQCKMTNDEKSRIRCGVRVKNIINKRRKDIMEIVDGTSHTFLNPNLCINV